MKMVPLHEFVALSTIARELLDSTPTPLRNERQVAAFYRMYDALTRADFVVEMFGPETKSEAESTPAP